MVFAVAPPLVEAAGLQIHVAGRHQVNVCERVANSGLFFYLGYAHAAYAGGSPREVAVNELFVESDRLEYLRAAVALDGGNAHLRHYLDDALVRGLYEVLFGGLVVHLLEEVVLAYEVCH